MSVYLTNVRGHSHCAVSVPSHRQDVGNMNAVLGIGEEYRIYRYLAGGCGSEHTSPLPDFGTLSGVLQWLSLPG